jgi:hypothetical protein
MVKTENCNWNGPGRLSLFELATSFPVNDRLDAFFNSPLVDIIEAHSDHVLYRDAPEEMLILFCGIKVVGSLARAVLQAKFGYRKQLRVLDHAFSRSSLMMAL